MSARPTYAIVPVKALDRAKRRLAPVLPDAARRRLVLAMLEDVLAAVARVEAIDRTVVVTPDAGVADLAQARGAVILREQRAAGLNAAVRRGLAHAAAQGASQALVLPADVPLATSDELLRVMETRAAPGRARAGLVPAGDGGGTNALLLSPPDALEPNFGPGSFLRHLAQAVAKRIDTQVLQLPGLGADMDRPDDLLQLLASERGRERYGFLAGFLASRTASPIEIGRERE